MFFMVFSFYYRNVVLLKQLQLKNGTVWAMSYQNLLCHFKYLCLFIYWFPVVGMKPQRMISLFSFRGGGYVSKVTSSHAVMLIQK